MLDETTAIGFVAASRETRPVESLANLAKDFRVLSSNMYLDNKDKTLWEMKEGASGKYLARNGFDNLESLVQASRISPTGSTPRLNRVAMASLDKHDLVAFVTQGTWTTDVNYGFCLATNANGDAIVVTDEGKQTVKSDFIIAAYQDDNLKPKKSVKASEFNEPINSMKDYYRLAYGNQDGGPGDAAQQAYVEKILTQIEEMGFA
jgi:phosphomannomutase